MRSKLKRNKSCKHAARAKKDQGQTNEGIEMSSESGCSDTDTEFDTNSTSCNNKPNLSNIDSKCTELAPIFLRTKQTSKGVSGYSRPHVIEVDSSNIPESDLDVRLRDVQIYNPTFPVNNIFCKLHKKSCQKVFTSNDKDHFPPVQNYKVNFNEDNQGPSVAEEDTATILFPPPHAVQDCTLSAPEKLHRTNRLSRTRRLKPEIVTLDEITELENKETKETKSDHRSTSTVVSLKEPFSEDVLWTDKYRPCHSSEIIGNIDAVERLHSWLRKWKLKSNIEDKKEKQNNAQSNDLWDCGDFEDEAGSDDGTEERLCNTILISGPPGVGKTASVYACAMELGFKVFEVNSSSQRSGREVLAQLKEATQSHLVEISGKDPLKPAFFSNYNTVRSSSKLDTLPVKIPKKATVSTSKKKPVQNRSNCKERVKAITLTNYFKTKAKADYLYHSGASPAKISTKCTNPALSNERKGTTGKKMTKSLILFEEVDVIFEDDVGFLGAIKTFMRTTKRPVVLTTSDPLFRERFNSSVDEIIFKTPSMADVCCYLRLVCLAENVLLDPDDVKTLFTVTQGDVRRCLLQLQLWANSGAGHGNHKSNEGDFTYKSCSANMLGLQSVNKKYLLQLLQPTLWTQQQMAELLQPMTESWRNGFPILYSNLELLLHVDANKLDKTDSDSDGKMPFCDTKEMETASGQYLTRSDAKTRSRLSRKKNILSPQMSSSPTLKKTQCATDKVETLTSLTALSDFFDIMSFIDAKAPAAQQLVATLCNVQESVWTGAKMQDGLLDEMKEEEDKNKEMMLDVGATLEALGFHQCRRTVSDTGEVHRSRQGDHFNTKNLNFITQHLDLHIVSQRLDLSKKILSSQYFSLLHNKRAVCIDYLPVVRFICRTSRKRKKHQAEELVSSVKAFRTQLRLTKETVQLLACEFS